MKPHQIAGYHEERKRAWLGFEERVKKLEEKLKPKDLEKDEDKGKSEITPPCT